MWGIDKSTPFVFAVAIFVPCVDAVHLEAKANVDVPSRLTESRELWAVAAPDVRCRREGATLETFPCAICCGGPWAGPELPNNPAP